MFSPRLSLKNKNHINEVAWVLIGKSTSVIVVTCISATLENVTTIAIITKGIKGYYGNYENSRIKIPQFKVVSFTIVKRNQRVSRTETHSHTGHGQFLCPPHPAVRMFALCLWPTDWLYWLWHSCIIESALGLEEPRSIEKRHREQLGCLASRTTSNSASTSSFCLLPPTLSLYLSLTHGANAKLDQS